MTVQDTDSYDYADNVSSAAAIFAEYGDFIYQIALYKSRDENLANDLVQNFFLSSVFHPIPKNIKNIKSYLYKAIVNDIFDQARRAKSQEKLLKKYAEQLDFSVNNNASQDAITKEEWYAKIFDIIGGRLSHSEARAIELRYKDGCSIEQVAEKMGVKKESVSRYISIGLKRIREIFGGKWGCFDDIF